MATVQSREELAFEAFRKRILTVDPDGSVSATPMATRSRRSSEYDGVDHFREHTNDIRAWFAAGGEPDPANDRAE